MNQTLRRRSLVTWSLVGLLLLAFALRTYTLGERELSFDEVASVFIAARGPLGLLNYVRNAAREHPPFYYLLLSLWMPLVGKSEFAVRFLSVIIGMTTVTVMYRLVRQATHLSAALLTTMLLVLSPFHVWVSRDTRMYGLLALWSLLSIFIFIRLLDQDRAHWWGLFWLVTGLGVFTHYFMVFLLAAENLFLLLKWRRYRHLWVRWLAIHGLLGGMVALWAIFSPGLGATLVSLWHRGLASEVRWHAFYRALNGLYLGATLRPNWYHLSLPLILTALGVTMAQSRSPWLPRGHRHDGVLLGLLIGVPLAAVLALPEGVTGRYLTPALPASILAMGLAIDQMGEWASRQASKLTSARVVEPSIGHWSLVICYLLFIAGIVFVDVRAYSPVYFPSGGVSLRAKAEYLRAHAQPGEALLLHGPWQRLLFSYYRVPRLKSYTIPLRDLKVDAQLASQTLTEIFDDHDRVWVSYDSVEPVDPDWLVARWLNEHTHRVWSQKGLTLYYAPPVQNLPPELTRDSPKSGSEMSAWPFHVFLPVTKREGAGGPGVTTDRYERVERVEALFGERLQLEGVALSNLEAASGEAFLILTQWRALQEIPHGLMVRMELVGPGDTTWQTYQFDIGPAHVPTQSWEAGETFIERRGVVVPLGAPPGDYTLRVRVFPPEEEEWLLEGDGHFEIGPLHVARSIPAAREIEALPGHDLRATFGDALGLVGYVPWGTSFTQGNPIMFDIYWQALTSPTENYELAIKLVGSDGAVHPALSPVDPHHRVGRGESCTESYTSSAQGGTSPQSNYREVLLERRVPLVAKWFPTDQWRAGDVFRGHYIVSLPVDAPPGDYQVRLSIYDSDGSPLPVSGTSSYRVLDWWERKRRLSGTSATLFEAKIEARPRRYRPPAMDHRLDVVLGDDVRLLGYDLASTTVEPGGSVELTLHWKALRRMERIYAVFNHLIDPDGTLLAQKDGWPQEGAYHTNQWLPGEIVEDHYAIPVPSDAPPGEYMLRVGMYDASTNERPITLVNGTPIPERYVELATITVSR